MNIKNKTKIQATFISIIITTSTTTIIIILFSHLVQVIKQHIAQVYSINSM